MAIAPSGWEFKEREAKEKGVIKKNFGDNIFSFGIPYSEHSSFSELRECISHFKPKLIVPTVNCHSPSKVESQLAYFADIYSGKTSTLLNFFSKNSSPPTPPHTPTVSTPSTFPQNDENTQNFSRHKKSSSSFSNPTPFNSNSSYSNSSRSFSSSPSISSSQPPKTSFWSKFIGSSFSKQTNFLVLLLRRIQERKGRRERESRIL